MTLNLKKLWNDFGIGAIVLLILLAYGVASMAGYLGAKGIAGAESNSGMQSQYKDGGASGSGGGSMAIRPSDPNGNEVFASASGMHTSVPAGMPSAGTNPALQNPADLLPSDSNSQWAQLNPSGKGELANINFLQAGYHIGVNTVSGTLRNANLQIRSEPVNPQLNVGPWNNSTIEPDFKRPPLEIGQGSM